MADGKKRVDWKHCDRHGAINANHAWGCPDCVAELRAENARLKREIADKASPVADNVSDH